MSAAIGRGVPARPRDRFSRLRARRRAAGRAARARRLRRARRRAQRPRHDARACAASSAAPGSSRTASSARARAARSAPRAATRSAAARCAPATAAGTSPRCSSRSRCTASRAARSTAASARAPPSAVRRLQAFSGLTADGVAGPATLAALSRAPVRAPALRRPIDAPLGDRYGPRGNQFHAGLDFPAPTGTAVTAAASGRAIFSGYDDGWGLTVVLDHGNGLHTRYAHLSVALISVGTAGHRRHPGRPRRRDRLRHRPAPALRGHRPRRQRRPGPRPRSLLRGQTP